MQIICTDRHHRISNYYSTYTGLQPMRVEMNCNQPPCYLRSIPTHLGKYLLDRYNIYCLGVWRALECECTMVEFPSMLVLALGGTDLGV